MSLRITLNFWNLALMGQFRNDKLILEIAALIKRLREEKGISQEYFYNQTDIHVGRIETGKSNLTLSSLSRICDFFEISLLEFFRQLDYQ